MYREDGMKKACAIIQARTDSTRLPGKVLLKILDKSILEYVIERVRRAKRVERIVVATSVKRADLKIVNLASGLGVSVYRGSEEDLLDRYYQAARLFNVKDIIRITADCPLMDPQVIDDVVERYFESGADYCSNYLEPTFPDGEDVAVFGLDTLYKTWKDANLLSEREHVTPYMWKHPDKFKIVGFKNAVDLSGKRWTLDEEEDFRFIKTVFESLYPGKQDFGMKDLLEFLKANPRVEEINRGIVRNEGYLKSLRKDRIVDITYTKG